MFNNGYGNFNQQPTGGYYSGMMYQEAPNLVMTQGLTPEQLKSLRTTGGFNLDVSQEELWRSYCTHRHENRFAVKTDDEGNFVCALCGTKFKPFEGDTADARELVDKVVDLMETTKMQALKLPTKTIQDYFQIEPFLKRLPELYSQSRSDYQKALGFNDGYVYGQENNAFVTYQNLINPMAGNGYHDPAAMNMQQPVFGGQPTQYGQVMYTQQPMNMGQPMYGQPQQYAQPMYNQPMMNNMQPMGQPQQNPFNVNSAPAPTQQAAPQQNNNEPEQVAVTKTLTD